MTTANSNKAVLGTGTYKAGDDRGKILQIVLGNSEMSPTAVLLEIIESKKLG